MFIWIPRVDKKLSPGRVLKILYNKRQYKLGFVAKNLRREVKDHSKKILGQKLRQIYRFSQYWVSDHPTSDLKQSQKCI